MSSQSSAFTSEGHFNSTSSNTWDSISARCNLVYKEVTEKIQSKDPWKPRGAVTFTLARVLRLG